MSGREIVDDLLSDYEEKWVEVDKIHFDPTQNPRKVKPPPEMIRGMRSSGPERTDPVTIVNDGSGFFVDSNGWQRVEAARILGWKKIRAKVTSSKSTAQSLSIIEDKRTPETDLQMYKRYYFLVRDLQEEKGLSREESIELANKIKGFSRFEVGERRVIIFEKLPPIILALMKEPENRTQEEIDFLEKFVPQIRRQTKKLGINPASAIAKHLSDRDVKEQIVVAALCCSMGLKAVDFVKKCVMFPEIHPFHICSELKRKKKPMAFQVSDLIRERINQLCASTHKNKNQLLELLINTAYKILYKEE